MFGIGMQELVIILVVALLVLGPTKLPQVARTLGKGMRELRKASDDLRSAVMVDFDDDDRPARVPPASPSLPAKDTPEPAIHGSLATTAGVPDESEATEGEAQREETLVRAASGSVPRGAAEPDPDDADDHAGMPFAPDSPDVDKMLDEARARAEEARVGRAGEAETTEERGDLRTKQA